MLIVDELCLTLFIDRGLSPAAAELKYLNKAKSLDLYGVELHEVLVSDAIGLSAFLFINVFQAYRMNEG